MFEKIVNEKSVLGTLMDQMLYYNKLKHSLTRRIWLYKYKTTIILNDDTQDMENILRKYYIIILLLFCWVGCYAQKHTIKTNFLFWGSATSNFAYEIALSNKTTLDLKRFL